VPDPDIIRRKSNINFELTGSTTNDSLCRSYSYSVRPPDGVFLRRRRSVVATAVVVVILAARWRAVRRSAPLRVHRTLRWRCPKGAPARPRTRKRRPVTELGANLIRLAEQKSRETWPTATGSSHHVMYSRRQQTTGWLVGWLLGPETVLRTSFRSSEKKTHTRRKGK